MIETRKKQWIGGIALLALSTGSGVIAAHADDTATNLSTITVDGQTETATGPVEGYVAKRSATGSKSDTPLKDIPQSVSVVGTQEMEDRGVTNKVDEALRYTSGVFTQPFGADGDTNWYYIRGFDATQTGTFLDGLNLWSYGFAGFLIDPVALERVEVLKGPASVLYGGSNPGGLVNMIGKRPTDEKFLTTETGINNYGNAYLTFDGGDQIKNTDMSYRLTGKIAGGNKAADDTSDFRGVFMPQLQWSPDEGTKLNVYAYYSYLDQTSGTNGFFPYVGTVEKASFGRIDPNANYGEPDSDYSYSRQFMLGADFSHDLDNGWTLSQTARYGYLNRSESAPYTYGYYDPTTGSNYLQEPTSSDAYLTRLGFDHHTVVNSFALDNHLNGKVDTGPVDHDVTVGIDYKYYNLNQIQASALDTPISATSPVYGVTQPANAVYLHQVLEQHQLGLYGQDQMHFGDGWIATLNGRYDYVHTSSDDRTATNADYTANNNALSGRAGLAYEFANGVTPYASVATFFNPQIGVTSGAPLKPEEGEQYEAGVKYEPTSFSGSLTASVFQINKRNWTVTDPLTFLSSQIGEVQSKGFELEGKVDLGDNWKALASFTYQHLEITRHSDASLIGNSPYLVPKVLASAWLDYSFPEGMLEGFSIGGGVRYQGSSWADYANTKKVPDATLFDAAIRYNRKDWGAALNIGNLFDKRYVAGCQTTLVCGYGEGRTVTLKISKRW
ncbi:TonB-dependent siderophore receptor [Allorhizobium sp. BGMRC 0089]|uniref:TonB-dependent siderophore receptor n=1 Tax=Allorhizobium sonneratiae TaxID=2934936 RepID=UPI0020344D9D|nr:TonB-dependent siderophore receptor [Allorhizobium sonneratiae]MCM2294617.1 TonB-dependent siderophore receptor [Allorhizobium sonneratiae]